MAFDPERYTLDELIAEIITTDDIMIIRKGGEPAVVMMTYQAWQDTTDELNRLTPTDGNRRTGGA